MRDIVRRLISEERHSGDSTDTEGRAAFRVCDKLRDALQAGLSQMQGQGGVNADRLFTVVGERLRDTLEERVTEGIRERLRDAVREGAENALQEKLRDSLRTAVAGRLSGRRGSGALQRFSIGGQAEGGAFAGPGAGVSPVMIESLRDRIVGALRERVAQDMRERVELIVRDRIEGALRERLGEALRTAFTEQIALGGGFDAEEISTAVRVRVADHIRDHVAEGMRERLGGVLRERLGDSIRSAVLQNATSGGGGQTMGEIH